MKISEVAKTLGICAQSLRAWEVQGLIPKTSRTMTGHRLYTEKDVETITKFLQEKHPATK